MTGTGGEFGHDVGSKAGVASRSFGHKVGSSRLAGFGGRVGAAGTLESAGVSSTPRKGKAE